MQKKRTNPNQTARVGNKKGVDIGSVTSQRHNSVLASSIIRKPDTVVDISDLRNETPRAKERTGAKWVSFYTGDNSFLKRMLAAAMYSPTLSRVLRDKIAMIVGDGFIAHAGVPDTILSTGAKRKPWPVSKTDALLSAISNVNAHGQTLVDVFKDAAEQYSYTGNCVLELVRGKVGQDSFLFAYNVPIYNCRLSSMSLDRKIDRVGVYDYWEEVPLQSDGTGFESKGFRSLPMYPEWNTYEDNTERCAIHIKESTPGGDYWGVPEWVAAIIWAEIEYQAQKHNTNRIENDFVPSAIIQLFGSMTPDEASELVTDIKNRFGGKTNAGEIFVQVLDDPTYKAHIQMLSQVRDGEYRELLEQASSNIITAARWSQALAGKASAGTLGSNQMVIQEMEYVQNTVVKPVQNVLLQRFVNVFLTEYAKWVDLKLTNCYLSISNSMPVSFTGAIDVNNVLERNEKRELIGFAPISEPEKIQTDEEHNNSV